MYNEFRNLAIEDAEHGHRYVHLSRSVPCRQFNPFFSFLLEFLTDCILHLVFYSFGPYWNKNSKPKEVEEQ